MAGIRKYTDEEIVTALKEMKGMVYLAAERIGCDASTIYERAKTSAAIAQTMKHERGRVVDTAELKLYNGILNSEPWAIQMALKCLGKDRGYVERTEVKSVKEVQDAIEHELARVAGTGATEDAGAPAPDAVAHGSADAHREDPGAAVEAPSR